MTLGNETSRPLLETEGESKKYVQRIGGRRPRLKLGSPEEATHVAWGEGPG